MNGSNNMPKLPQHSSTFSWYQQPPKPELNGQNGCSPSTLTTGAATQIQNQITPSTTTNKDTPPESLPTINSPYPVHYIPLNWTGAGLKHGGKQQQQLATSMGSQFQIGQGGEGTTQGWHCQATSGQHSTDNGPVHHGINYNGFIPAISVPAGQAPAAQETSPAIHASWPTQSNSDSNHNTSGGQGHPIKVVTGNTTGNTTAANEIHQSSELLCGNCKACKYQSERNQQTLSSAGTRAGVGTGAGIRLAVVREHGITNRVSNIKGSSPSKTGIKTGKNNEMNVSKKLKKPSKSNTDDTKKRPIPRSSTNSKLK